MENNKDKTEIAIVVIGLSLAVFAFVFFVVIAAFVYVFNRLKFTVRYEDMGEIVFFVGFTLYVLFDSWSIAFDSSNPEGIGILALAYVAIPAALAHLMRLIFPISPYKIKYIDSAHLNYDNGSISKAQRDSDIKFAKKAPVDEFERAYAETYQQEENEQSSSNDQKRGYDDFEENTHQSQTNNTKPDDEFSYDDGRFSDDRFSTPKKKQSYKAACKAENDKSISLEERIPYFKFREQADEGKIKGIAPWQPPKP